MQLGPRPIRTAQPVRTSRIAKLPNGLRLAYYNQDELVLLHNEILSRPDSCTYLRHGVQLSQGSTVLDVGANIGLFSLAASRLVGPSGKVIGLEPMPDAFHAAQLNISMHMDWCEQNGVTACKPDLLGVAAGSQPREGVTFTVYDKAMGWSSLLPDDGEVAENMRAFLRRHLQPKARVSPSPLPDAGQLPGSEGPSKMGEGLREGGPSNAEVKGDTEIPESLLVHAGRALRLVPGGGWLCDIIEAWAIQDLLASKREVVVDMMTISQVIDEQGLQNVDLLKIDVERGEVDVLAGIRPEHWPLIQQLSCEFHDLEEKAGEGAWASLDFSSSTSPTKSHADAGGLEETAQSSHRDTRQGAAGSLQPSSATTVMVKDKVEMEVSYLRWEKSLQGETITEKRSTLLTSYLASVGFESIVVQQEPEMAGTNLYMLYASRGKNGVQPKHQF